MTERVSVDEVRLLAPCLAALIIACAPSAEIPGPSAPATTIVPSPLVAASASPVVATRLGSVVLGAEPLGIAMAPIRHRTFVRTTDAVVVVDWDPVAIRATLPLGNGVSDGIAYDAQYGVGYAAASDGTLAVITTPGQTCPRSRRRSRSA